MNEVPLPLYYSKNKKTKKGKDAAAAKDSKDTKGDKKGGTADKKGQPPSTDRGQKSQGGSRHDPDHKGGASDRPESHQTEKSDDDPKWVNPSFCEIFIIIFIIVMLHCWVFETKCGL